MASQATRRSDAPARERRPPVGTAPRRGANRTNPPPVMTPLSARTPPSITPRRQGNADLRSAQPAEGGRREGPRGVVRLQGWFVSAGTPAFSVIRTGSWYTPFAALRAAVPAPTGRTGQRSAFPCRHDIWTVGVPAPGCIYTATGQRSVFPDRRHHLDGGVPVRPAFSQQRAGSPSSLSDTPSGRSGSALHL